MLRAFGGNGSAIIPLIPESGSPPEMHTAGTGETIPEPSLYDSTVLPELSPITGNPTEFEFTQRYFDIGEALQEMTDLGKDDDWRIDSDVCIVASNVASYLMAQKYPPPHLFSHGSDSVVFTWTDDKNDLCLTISPRNASILVSSRDRIELRMDEPVSALLANPLTLSGAQAAFLGRPVTLQLPASIAE